MGRACCVPGCNSGIKVPSHKFPKCPKRCLEWIESLKLDHLKNYCANQLQKYKICHKHFREEDYSLSLHHRFLLNTAIPILFVTDCNIETITSNVQSHSFQQQIQEETKTQHSQIEQLANDQNKHTDAMKLLEPCSNEFEQLQLKEMHVNNNMQQIELKNIVLQQSVSGNKMLKQQETIKKDIKNHEHRLQNLETQMSNIKKILKRRPQLQEITRIRMLSPDAKKLYDLNNKLKRRNRYLKSLIKRRKSQEKKRALSSLQHNIESTTSTATVRERFVNMIVRNSDIPSQV